MEEEILKEYLEYIKSDECKRASKVNLVKQMTEFLKSQYPDAEIELDENTTDDITIRVSGTDEDKINIIRELNDFGLVV